MRVPISWLAEYVNLPKNVTPEHLHEDLVRVGFEEEDIIPAAVSGPVVVGQVIEFVDEPQTNGKTIRWCQVKVTEQAPAADGGDSIRGIVCGASNFEVGDKVVVTLPGAVLPGDFQIAARKTYGHISDGMLASAKELGLGEDHDGIIVLERLGLDPEIGSDAKALLGIDDAAVEINVTTDRGYALSIRGIAREYSHATGVDFRDPALRDITDPVLKQEATGFDIVLNDERPLRDRLGCTVFMTRAVRGIDPTKPTPPWMASRLTLAGIRPISVAVDITNYVMLELGQPLHAYDLEKLTGGITVRRAAENETIKTLDGQVRTLDVEDLLITDGAGPIGLAGVMGGFDSEITDSTVDVLIEAANFDPVTIMRSARRHKLPSEASKRFERGVDPKIAIPAVNRVAELLVAHAGGSIDTLGSTVDLSEDLPNIVLPKGFSQQLMGVEYEEQQVRETLEIIGGEILDENEERYLVKPPSWRPDLGRKSDLVEEVGRIIGYDLIPSIVPVPPAGRGLTEIQQLRRTLANALAGAGLTEVITFPFLGTGENARFAGENVPTEKGRLKEYVSPIPETKLGNALDGEAPYLRRTLLPGLLKLAHRNHGRGLTDLQVYEIGSVFLPEAGVEYGHENLPAVGAPLDSETYDSIQKALIPQRQQLGVLFLGHHILPQTDEAGQLSDWRDALDVARQAFRAVGAEMVIRQGNHPALHPGRTAELFVQVPQTGDLISVGHAGEVLPSLLGLYHLPRTVPYMELDLTLLLKHVNHQAQATPLKTMSAATQDLSLVVGSEIPAADILDAVKSGAGELLEEIRLVADYRGDGVADDEKSLTFALRFRAADRTLKAAEANEAKLRGVALAAEKYGATIRE